MHHTHLRAARRERQAVLLVVVGALLAACTASLPGTSEAVPQESASDRPMRTDAPADRADPSSPDSVVGEVPADVLDAVLADAAARTGLEAAELEVLRGEAITWPDGSLGCREPGMTYTQALVDGYRVVVDAGGEELDYRVGAAGGFRICADSGTPSGD